MLSGVRNIALADMANLRQTIIGYRFNENRARAKCLLDAARFGGGLAGNVQKAYRISGNEVGRAERSPFQD